MSSPPTPETAPALAPSTPEREMVLPPVDQDADREHPSPFTDVSRELASLTLLGEREENEEASSVTPSTSSSPSPPLVTLVSVDGFRLTVPRRVAEESGTVRQLLLSRGDATADASDDVTIPLPAIRKRELASIFDFCERQLRGRDELERLRQREEREQREQQQQAQAKRTRSGRDGGGGGGGAKAAAAASPPPAAAGGPSPAALALALRAALAADAASWASSPAAGGGSSFSSRALLGRTLAANYLDVPAALAACADAVAGGLRGRSPAEIRARFGIAPDLSRAEEEAIKADCAWAFDCC